MELINLSSKEVKYSINDDGTLIIAIGEDYLLKLSWGELRSLDMIISEQQSEAIGIAKNIIEKIKKGIENIPQPEEKKINTNETEKIFHKEVKKRFINFLESYLSKDEETVEVFKGDEIRSVLGQEFLVSELKEEFGEKYSFKELDNDLISVTLLVTSNNI